MKMVFCLWVGILFCGLACESTTGAVQVQSAENAQVEPEKANTSTKKKEDTPRVFMTLEHKETGELKEVEAEVTMVPGERFFLPSFNPAAAASFQQVNLVDSDKQSVQVDLDRVVLIEYWSDDGLTQNQYWSQMRQLEEQYKDSDEVRLLSINYDMTLDGESQIENALATLANFSRPKQVLFDLNDGFRDSFPVIGPSMYILVDSRKQITYFGRGDNPKTQEVFDNLRDAILHLRGKRSGGIQILNSQEN